MRHDFKAHADHNSARFLPNYQAERNDEMKRREMDKAFVRHFAECQARYGTPVSKPVPPKLVLKG